MDSAFKKLRSCPLVHHFIANRWGTMETVTDFIFLGSKITADGDCSHEIKRCLLLGRKAITNLDSILKSRDITCNCLYSQGYGFPSSHVWMWELDHKESWGPKNWYFWTVMLVEMQTDNSHYGEQYGNSFKNWNKTTIWPSNPTTGHTLWGNNNWKRHMYSNVHCSTIYNS